MRDQHKPSHWFNLVDISNSTAIAVGHRDGEEQQTQKRLHGLEYDEVMRAS